MIGFPYDPNNCAIVTSQVFNANQFNDNVPYSSNNTTHNKLNNNKLNNNKNDRFSL